MNDKYKITELKQFAESIMNTSVVQDFVQAVGQRFEFIGQVLANFEPTMQAAPAVARVQQDAPRRQ